MCRMNVINCEMDVNQVLGITYTMFIVELTVLDWRAPKMKNLPNTTALKNAPTVPV